MKLPITAALMLVVLAVGTEAGWIRKTLRTVGQAARGTIERETVRGIGSVVSRFGPSLAGRFIGKRSVDWAKVSGKTGDALARSLIGELDKKCRQYSNLQNKQGLTAGDLQVVFSETDDNKDGRLNNVELDLFENVVDAVQHCLEVVKTSRTVPVQGM